LRAVKATKIEAAVQKRVKQDQARAGRRIKQTMQCERLGLIAAPDSYAVHPYPTTPPNVGMSVEVSHHRAMRSNAPSTIWIPATHHGIGVIPINGHCGQECHHSECYEHDSFASLASSELR